mmetsp:Transcript_14488/g.33529  ORF Transcript_14488/g.33529 Transcript_14488/m.33529 type:complete len:153 (+) Transcript_14488:57-515(+)
MLKSMGRNVLHSPHAGSCHTKLATGNSTVPYNKNFIDLPFACNMDAMSCSFRAICLRNCLADWQLSKDGNVLLLLLNIPVVVAAVAVVVIAVSVVELVLVADVLQLDIGRRKPCFSLPDDRRGIPPELSPPLVEDHRSHQTHQPRDQVHHVA